MNIVVLSLLKKLMFKYGRNEKSLSYDRLFEIELLSLTGTHAMKATNRSSTDSFKSLSYSYCLSIGILIFFEIFKDKLRKFSGYTIKRMI